MGASSSGEPSGRVFDISRGCVDDGPGLRTVVFLKGCRLDCPWCHNPEGKSFEPEVAFDAARCIGCGACEKACPRTWASRGPDGWRAGCTACGACALACPSGARRLVGRAWSVEELAAELMKDADFFAGTGGGVTFSGGEPMLQPAFLLACARALRAHGVHVALETAGLWPEKLADAAVSRFDLVLFDVKHVEPERFHTTLGKPNDAILLNLARVLDSPVAMELRLTLVPGFNDSPDDLRAIARWLAHRPRRPEITLQAFHRLAAAKQALFACSYPYARVEPARRDRIVESAAILECAGLAVRLG
jgi:pyruvate formate lyase activating enzyme